MTETSSTITADLLSRLSTRGPRYTSYPTALHFHDGVNVSQLSRVMMDDAQARERPVSLYVHVPYCQKLCWYCACHKKVERDLSKGDDFVKTLIQEMTQRAPLLEGRTVQQVHFGGGTPTFLSADALVLVLTTMRALYDVAEDAEISIEIDPRICTPEQMRALADCGVKRVSLGIQDTDPAVQEAINRVQPLSCIRACVEGLRDVGINHINLDLIYGLPHQTIDTLTQTLEDIEEFRPNRLAIYGYAHVPWAAPAQKLLERHVLPSSEVRLEMLAMISTRLEAQGYIHIGMDHYARPDDTLALALNDGTLQRNFQGYSTQKGVDIHGFGPSAISAVPGFYAQNFRDINMWRDAVETRLSWPVERGVLCTKEDQMRREIIMTLMCRREVSLAELGVSCDEGMFDVRFAAELARLRHWADEGLVEMHGAHVKVTTLGRHFLRNLAMCFDAYLHPDAGTPRMSQTQYSRTV